MGFQEAYEHFAYRHPSISGNVEGPCAKSVSTGSSSEDAGSEGAALIKQARAAAGNKKSSPVREAVGKLQASAKAPPGLGDLSRRLRLMQLPSPSLRALAIELADDVDVAMDMQREILSMQKFEELKRVEVTDRFERVLDY